MNDRNIITVILYLVILALVFFWMTRLFSNDITNMPYSQVVELFQSEQVRAFSAQEGRLTMQLRTADNGGTTLTVPLADVEEFRRELWDLIQEQSASGVLESYDFPPLAETGPYDYVLPLILVGLAVLLVWFFLMGRLNSGGNPMSNFSRARANIGLPEGQKVTFDDVAGAEEEKAELQEVVDFLRAPEKFNDIGARVPHGILLVGPPGTGKTLLARAVAGEAGVEFLSISGSDFVELYVGVGAGRVRDLFEQAKKVAPSIVFIDEIDAVGRKRGAGLGGGHDEREQTLNQLLVEMDGFGKTEGVIVLAATNRPDILDNALLRPGRFDRQIYVGVPDARGREEILKVHSKDKRLDGSVDLKTVANRTVLNMKDLNDAMMKIMAGPEKRSRVIRREDLRLTAIHEAGHAVAMYSLPTHSPVRQISVIPRGNALGLTWSWPQEDSTHQTRNEMFEQIVGLLGGRVAEALFLRDISTGASNDIDRASKLARDMVARYGMCQRLGTVSYTSDDEVFLGRDYEKTKSYSEEVAGIIDQEVKAVIDQAYEKCKAILTRDGEKLRQVAEFLLKNETMTGAQFTACMEGRPIPEADSIAMLTPPPEEA